MQFCSSGGCHSWSIAAGPPLTAILLGLGALGWLDFRLNLFLNIMTPLIMVISFSDSMQLTFAARDRLIAGENRYQAFRNALLVVGPACVLTHGTAGLSFIALQFSQSDLIRSFGEAGLIATLIALVTVLTLVPLLGILLVRHEAQFAADAKRTDRAVRISPRRLRLDRGSHDPSPGPLQPGRPCRRGDVRGGVCAAAAALPSRRPGAGSRSGSCRGEPARFRIDGIQSHQCHDRVSAPGLALFAGDPAGDCRGSRDHAETSPELEMSGRWRPCGAGWRKRRAGRTSPPSSNMSIFSRNIWYGASYPPIKMQSSLPVACPISTPAGYVRSSRRWISALASVRVQYPGYTISVTSLSAIAARNSASMIEKLNRGLTVEVVFVAAFIGLAFRSFRVMCASILPAVFPIVVSGSLLWILGDGLQFASIIALTVSFGLGLSATIHFLNRMRQEERPADDAATSVQRATVLVGPALILTSVVLSCGLVVTVFSNLPSLRLFGWLSTLAMMLALVADLTILRPVITFLRSTFQRAH